MYKAFSALSRRHLSPIIYAPATRALAAPISLSFPGILKHCSISMSAHAKSALSINAILDASGVTKHGALLEETFEEKERAELQVIYDQEMKTLRAAAFPILTSTGYKSWGSPNLTEKDVQIEPVNGALTNLVFKCTHNREAAQREKILLRIFGTGTDHFFSRKDEMALFAALSGAGINQARLLNSFENGRCEVYLNSYVTILPEAVKDPAIQDTVARKMRQLHTLQLEDCPASRKTGFLWKTLWAWYDYASTVCTDSSFKEANLAMLRNEIEWLEKKLKIEEIVKSPEVFGHNDLQYGNIMRNKEPPYDLCFIDFEYAGYVPRGFDFAHFFAEFAADYSGCNTEAHILDYVNRSPSLSTRYSFYRSYLEGGPVYPGSDEADEKKVIEIPDEELYKFDEEVRTYTLLNHIYWGLWGLIQATTSTIEFNFVEYGMQRFRQYHIDKEELDWFAKEKALTPNENEWVLRK